MSDKLYQQETLDAAHQEIARAKDQLRAREAEVSRLLKRARLLERIYSAATHNNGSGNGVYVRVRSDFHVAIEALRMESGADCFETDFEVGNIESDSYRLLERVRLLEAVVEAADIQDRTWHSPIVNEKLKALRAFDAGEEKL